MKRNEWILCVTASTLLAAITLSAAERTVAGGPAGVDVKIDKFSFAPAAITGQAGTNITLTDVDDISPTLVSRRPGLKYKKLRTDEEITLPARAPAPDFC